MSHARTQIRTAAIACLMGLATTANRVMSGRVLPVDPTKMAGPVLLVACGNEPSIERGSVGMPHEQIRQVQLLVRGCAKVVTTLEDTLDQIALEVEKAMAGASALRTMVQDLQLESVVTGIDESLEKPCGVVLLTYFGHYFVKNDHPETLL